MPAFKNDLPILLSIPIPSATFSTSAPESSQMLAIALMNDIFVARKELDACFMSSALLMSVTIICAFIWLYSSFMALIALSLSDPMTMRSGSNVSLIAVPSLKNSGLLTTSNSTFFLMFFLIMLFTCSPVSTGTVLLCTIILYESIVLAISSAAFFMYLRSVSPVAFGGVPTQMNIASACLIASLLFDVNLSLFLFMFLSTSSFNPGS